MAAKPLEDKVINIFLENGQRRQYLINKNHTVERITSVVFKDHDPTFGGTISSEEYTGNYCLSVVTFFAERGEYDIRRLQQDSSEVLYYILFPHEHPSRQQRKGRNSKRFITSTPSKTRFELLFHREDTDPDLTEPKYEELFVPAPTAEDTDVVSRLAVRIANPAKTGVLRKFSAKKNRWAKKYFMLKHGVLWYCASSEDQTNRKSISLVGADPIVKSKTFQKCFEINTPIRVYVLVAGTMDEMHSWIKILNAQRKYANQNDHIQLAEFFASDYESSRTNKEHEWIQSCFLSLEYVLGDRRAASLFQKFANTLQRPDSDIKEDTCADLLKFYSKIKQFCCDLEVKSNAVDQLWIVFETIAKLLQPSQYQESPLKPLPAVVLGEVVCNEFVDRVAKYRSRRMKLQAFNATLDEGSVPPPSLSFAVAVRDTILEHLRTDLYPKFLRSRFYKAWINAAPFKSM